MILINWWLWVDSHLVRVEDDIDCRVGGEQEVVDLDEEDHPLRVDQLLVSHHLQRESK